MLFAIAIHYYVLSTLKSERKFITHTVSKRAVKVPKDPLQTKKGN